MQIKNEQRLENKNSSDYELFESSEIHTVFLTESLLECEEYFKKELQTKNQILNQEIDKKNKDQGNLSKNDSNLSVISGEIFFTETLDQNSFSSKNDNGFISNSEVKNMVLNKQNNLEKNSSNALNNSTVSVTKNMVINKQNNLEENSSNALNNSTFSVTKNMVLNKQNNLEKNSSNALNNSTVSVTKNMVINKQNNLEENSIIFDAHSHSESAISFENSSEFSDFIISSSSDQNFSDNDVYAKKHKNSINDLTEISSMAFMKDLILSIEDKDDESKNNLFEEAEMTILTEKDGDFDTFIAETGSNESKTRNLIDIEESNEKSIENSQTIKMNTNNLNGDSSYSHFPDGVAVESGFTTVNKTKIFIDPAVLRESKMHFGLFSQNSDVFDLNNQMIDSGFTTGDNKKIFIDKKDIPDFNKENIPDENSILLKDKFSVGSPLKNLAIDEKNLKILKNKTSISKQNDNYCTGYETDKNGLSNLKYSIDKADSGDPSFRVENFNSNDLSLTVENINFPDRNHIVDDHTVKKINFDDKTRMSINFPDRNRVVDDLTVENFNLNDPSHTVNNINSYDKIHSVNSHAVINSCDMTVNNINSSILNRNHIIDDGVNDYHLKHKTFLLNKKLPSHQPMRRYNIPEKGHSSTAFKENLLLVETYEKIRKFFKKQEEEWIFTQFKWTWLHLFVKNSLKSEDLYEEILEIMKLRLKYEHSVLRRIVEFDDVASKFLILGIINFDEFTVELFDGFYSVYAQIDKNIHSLFKKNNCTLGSKIFVYGSELLIKNPVSIFEIQNKPVLKLQFNSVKICSGDFKLGPARKVAFLNSISSISKDGGVISCLIVRIVRVIEQKYLVAIESYRNRVDDIEKEMEKIMEIAEKTGHKVDSNSIRVCQYVKAIVSDETGECLLTWWQPPEIKAGEKYKLIYVKPVSNSMGIHVTTSRSTYWEKV